MTGVATGELQAMKLFGIKYKTSWKDPGMFLMRPIVIIAP